MDEVLPPRDTALRKQLLEWLVSDPVHRDALLAVADLGLSDGLIAAGFVRNLAWDLMHGYRQPTPLHDIDVIHFDREACSRERDDWLQQRLCHRIALPWSVKNQARMHARNQHAPYRSSADAMAHWPEVETAVGVRLRDPAVGAIATNIELIAPFGVTPLFADTISLNRRAPNPAVFRERSQSKEWCRLWPRLRLVDQKG